MKYGRAEAKEDGGATVAPADPAEPSDHPIVLETDRFRKKKKKKRKGFQPDWTNEFRNARSIATRAALDDFS